MIARQATCVAISGRAVLIEGAPGTGKSSLALALIDRGAILVGDDSVMVEQVDGVLRVSPHPNTRGLLEVRNIGLVPMAVAQNVPVALVCSLRRGAPRFIDAADVITIASIRVPEVSLEPLAPQQAICVELALQKYGLASLT